MGTDRTFQESSTERVSIVVNEGPNPVEIDAGLLTGGGDRPYAFGLAMALVSRGVGLDVIGSDEVDSPEMHNSPKLTFLNLRGNQRRDASIVTKISRILTYYVRLLRYTSTAKPRVFHILWNNKFEFFDRSFLMLYYKLWRKKVVLTAHNVNQGRRDSNDSWLNRLTLKVQYHLADHIFVHTRKMKRELIDDFAVDERLITVIDHPINNAFPDTSLTSAEARQRLGLSSLDRTMLFFGRIVPYKGLEYLVDATRQLVGRTGRYRLIIAGQPESESYWCEISQMIKDNFSPGQVIERIQFIPDAETELYFKAADVLVLPYKDIFQSGVLFLGYSFGLPVVATDVGSLKDEIIEGTTGFMCRSCDSVELASTIEKYFASDLFNMLDRQRQAIREHANAHHSWDVVGELTRNVYAGLVGK
jgi:D-inositol-3-phosphate glycosyltransferase